MWLCNMESSTENNENKQITIQGTRNRYLVKQSNRGVAASDTPAQNRQITQLWASYLHTEDFAIEVQQACLQRLLHATVTATATHCHRRVRMEEWMRSEIERKRHAYQQQDRDKGRFDASRFVPLSDVLQLLVDSQLACAYCQESVYVLYEKVREKQQWTLDRIDNIQGHNRGNLLVACLSCNLKRRRTNQQAFHFTKRLVLTKNNDS